MSDRTIVLLGIVCVLAYSLMMARCDGPTRYEGSIWQELGEHTQEIGD